MCAFLWKITICQIHIDCEGTFGAHHCISGDGGPKRDCLPRRRTLPRWKQNNIISREQKAIVFVLARGLLR